MFIFLLDFYHPFSSCSHKKKHSRRIVSGSITVDIAWCIRIPLNRTISPSISPYSPVVVYTVYITYTYIYIYIIHNHTYKHIYIYTYMHIYIYIYIVTYYIIFIDIWVHTLSLYIYIYVHWYIQLYLHCIPIIVWQNHQFCWSDLIQPHFSGFPLKPLLFFVQCHQIQLWPFISYNWLFQWDYTFYKWGFLSTYNWYFGP